MKKIFHKKIFLTACMIFAAFFIIFCLVFAQEKDSADIDINIRPDNAYDEKLRVVADWDYEPYSFYAKDETPSGYDVEFLYALANQMEMNVEVRLMNWKDCKAAVLNGSADMVMGLDHQTDETYNFIYSIAMNSDRFVCFGKEKFNIVGELYDKKLATLDQSGSITAFLEPYGLLENTAYYPSYTEAFESVASGENEYVIARYSVGTSILSHMEDSDIGPMGPSLANNSMCIGMNKSETELQKKVNDNIKLLIQDGTFEKLSDKWLGKYKEITSIRDFFGVYHGSVFIMVSGIVMFFLLITYFYFQNTKFVKREFEFTSRRLEYQQLLVQATKGLYETIYEVDITRNCVTGEGRESFFTDVGVAKDVPYDQVIHEIANKQIKEEFKEGYQNTFLPSAVLDSYQKGKTSLVFDFMKRNSQGEYYWMRIFARIFFWSTDRSVRMIVYRQNIDAEVKKEQELLEKAQQDAMTQLYNKAFTERIVRKILTAQQGEENYIALLMLDIDNFKRVNDSLGHAFGDYVIMTFAGIIRRNGGKNDIVGRFGGDEFLMFLQDVPDFVWIQEKLDKLNHELSQDVVMNGNICKISASIGAAVCKHGELDFDELYRRADQALYVAKKKGKDGSHIY